jgi:tetratricopeptide (TPR) repeat protein
MAMLYENRMLSAEAVKRCDSVLHKDPANWRASFCRARNSELSEAIERLKAVISCQESDSLWMQDPTHKKDLAEMTYALAGKYRLLNNFELVIPTVALSLKQDPQRIDQAFDAMGWYWVNEKWEAILSLLEQVASFDNQEHLADMVVRYAKFVFFNQIIQQTVATTQQFGIVHTVYQAGIRKAKKQNDAKALFMFHYYYGNVLYGQSQRPEDQIIELWEAALKVDLPSSDFEVAGRLSQIYAGLGGLYLQRALVAKDNADPAAAEDSLRRLSDMVPEEVTQAQLPLPPQLYIARFHHVNGDHAKAREIVRTLVQIALELLSDEDTKNDYQAFAKLLYIFIPLGDKKNTVAAWTLLALCTKAEHEADPDSSDDSDDDDDEPNYYLGLSCFGQCKHQWKVPSKIQICMNCIMVCLEDNCLKKLREGKLELNICHPSHDYLEVPEWDEGRMASLPKGEVPWENLPWGERNITLEEWKQEIRKEYIGLDA